MGYELFSIAGGLYFTNEHIGEGVDPSGALWLFGIAFAFFSAKIAFNKGYNYGWAIIGGALFGVLSFVYYAALPDKRLQDKLNFLHANLTKPLTENKSSESC